MKEDNIRLGSIAEELFIDIFGETFGEENTKYLFIQYPVVDIYGNHRYIDFALESEGQKIAIEIDGGTYHDPSKISTNKYYDDLLKQNSLIHENWKVYRWPYKILLEQRERVKDELLTFLGELPMFMDNEDFLPEQKGRTLILKDHQKEALDNLEDMRNKGESIALLYHATGTGKTITAISDAKKVGKKTLFLAHTKELIEQAEKAFGEVWGEVACGTFTGDVKEKDKQVVCATVQSISGNLQEFNKEDFGYIIVDEAHHGSAETYRKILRHFKPEFILGLTATPERSDGEEILSIFKNIAHRLDLKKAVELGELVPIRCIRVKTNVDIRNVRIHGIKYNTQDLESKLFLPERNNIIIDTYLKFVKGKHTVIFCASVDHAEEVANLFKNIGVRAEAVSGRLNSKKRQNILSDYENGEIDVLCACDLLNEGWDSPKTEVLFMARPTMSKTIYMQQLGRGTRKSEGKEYLMVFDFIDNANLFNMPYSLHRMFNIEKYIPGSLVLAKSDDKRIEEEIFLKGEKPEAILDFPVDVTDYELVDLFNWQEKANGMISQIEFLRMVDVQSETLNKYINDEKIKADLEVPMGNKTVRYFNEDTVKKYAKEFRWDIINPSNMKEKFMEMVKTMKISYSYKLVLLMAMLENVNEKGKVLIDDIVDYFVEFYEDRKARHLVVEKEGSLYCREKYSKKEVKRNIFVNPFKRFEDMGFMKKSKDVEYVEFNYHVWKKLSREEKIWIERYCEEKLEEYYNGIK